MAQPELKRKAILDSYVAALETVVEGVDYRHTLTVTRKPRSIEQVNASECPHLIVVGGPEPAGELQVSQKAADNMEVVMQGYVKPDPQRWPGMSAAEILEEVLGDVKKAVDRDPARGVQAYRKLRDIDVAHHLEGAWSVFVITDTLETRRVR